MFYNLVITCIAVIFLLGCLLFAIGVFIDHFIMSINGKPIIAMGFLAWYLDTVILAICLVLRLSGFAVI